MKNSSTTRFSDRVENYRKLIYPNRQLFDLKGLNGRLLSSSYAPNTGQPGHDEMMAELDRIFRDHEVEGNVSFDYFATTYLGRLTVH